MLSALFVALTIGAAYGSTVIPLDASVTSNIDIETRREILIIILGKINDTVNAYRSSIAGCEQQINDTIDECNTCRANMCQPQPNLGQQILGTISAGVNKPVVFAGKVIDDAGNWFKNSGDWMGKRATTYSRAVGSVATNVGNTLSSTGQQVFSEIVSGFNSLGGEFEKLGDTLEDAFKNPLGGFLNLGSGITNLDSYLKSALNGVENSLNSFADTLSGWGSDIGDFFKGLGRKRRSIVLLRHRRCVNSCPACDKLDTSKYTTEQITQNICGAATVASQSQAINDVEWLQTTYNDTIDNVLITVMEFDYTSASYPGGLPQYGVSFYTTAATGRKQKDTALKIAQQDIAGQEIAAEYFPKKWDNRPQQ